MRGEKDLSCFVLILAEFSPRLGWSRRLQSAASGWPNTNTIYFQIHSEMQTHKQIQNFPIWSEESLVQNIATKLAYARLTFCPLSLFDSNPKISKELLSICKLKIVSLANTFLSAQSQTWCERCTKRANLQT